MRINLDAGSTLNWALNPLAREFHAHTSKEPLRESGGVFGLKAKGSEWSGIFIPLTNMAPPDKKNEMVSDPTEWHNALALLARAGCTLVIFGHTHHTGLRPSRGDVRRLGKLAYRSAMSADLNLRGFDAPLLYMVMSQATGRWGVWWITTDEVELVVENRQIMRKEVPVDHPASYDPRGIAACGLD